MGQMTRHLPAAGAYAPVTILIQELPDGATQVAYDTVASAIAPYADAAASQVAQQLDTEVLALLRQATGTPATATRAAAPPCAAGQTRLDPSRSQQVRPIV
jgi:hypothetical protein